jgi:IS4 transposase
MYITNTEKAKISAEAIRNIYRLRWQVELVFKTWKSTYNIDKTHKMKYERWMTLFYAKMLAMLIHWQICHLVKQTKFKLKNKLLSISKSIKSLQLVSKKSRH